ncbi:MAG: nucleotide exchange factor GrpE [Coriobacteriia bacterium]|nr:nucleotide exchange factor GrpE [Coriobacteriia bacterium]
MTKRDGAPTGDTSGRGPREDHAAEAPFGTVGGSPEAGLDPELLDDLGAEFGLRGDVMEDELEAARAEAAEMRDAALRAQADFENFRKRTAREREDERKRAAERLVEELLPAIDNLERAIEHTSADHDIEHLITGVTSVHAQIVGVLGKHGVSVIDPLGQPFDPSTQQAVSQQEDPTVPAGTVVAAFQKGYEMGGRIVRPAMVVVSTGGPQREE